MRGGAGSNRYKARGNLKTVSDMAAGDAVVAELMALSAEIVDLFYAQMCAPDEFASEASVCQAFTDILIRQWDLCCISTFLRDDEQQLRPRALYTRPDVDADAARQCAQLLTNRVEQTGREQQVQLDRNVQCDDDDELAMRHALAAAGMQAGGGIPIHARGTLDGVLVVLSAYPERLRTALVGLRFMGPRIVIALGYAHQSAAIREQHARIEQLVAELQQRTGALETANRELQRVGRYRSLFLGRMSHELRTPLTSILGFAEILLEHEELSAAQRRFCEKIQGSGLQLHTSIKHLVDLSRLEAGHTELFLHDFPVREMLRESCAVVGRLAQKQCVRLNCETDVELGTIVSDEGKLRQVLYNFLAHAIGRSPQGAAIAVNAYPTQAERFCIEIKDDGEPLSDPKHFFNPVEMDTPNECGTNMNELGLVIAHRLLAALDGTVALAADTGRGLTVRLELPTRPQKH